jgi:hypothetical protein
MTTFTVLTNDETNDSVVPLTYSTIDTAIASAQLGDTIKLAENFGDEAAFAVDDNFTVLRLRTHNQNMTVAARAIAERKTVGDLS